MQNKKSAMTRMKKAHTLDEIDQAVGFNDPIEPNHPFFTDFRGLRGDFEERIIYKYLNVKVAGDKYTFNYKVDSFNKTLLFLGGMRGSGKTSELAKYVSYLNNPDCFFCVTCNIDDELDMDNVEYMDILIFQLEKLVHKLEAEGIHLEDAALESLQKWFSERVEEINTNIKGETKIEIGVSAEKSIMAKIIGLVGELKAGISGTKERQTSIRSTFKNRFGDFALKFNEFVEDANSAVRKVRKGQEVLFIIDGLEKILSLKTRREVLIDGSNRLRQIKAYSILPYQLS